MNITGTDAVKSYSEICPFMCLSKTYSWQEQYEHLAWLDLWRLWPVRIVQLKIKVKMLCSQHSGKIPQRFILMFQWSSLQTMKNLPQSDSQFLRNRQKCMLFKWLNTFSSTNLLLHDTWHSNRYSFIHAVINFLVIPYSWLFIIYCQWRGCISFTTTWTTLTSKFHFNEELKQ